MNLTAEIARSQAILDELYRQVQELESIGIPSSDKVFDLMAERMEQEIMKMELLFYTDWEFRYWMHNTEEIDKN